MEESVIEVAIAEITAMVSVKSREQRLRVYAWLLALCIESKEDQQ